MTLADRMAVFMAGRDPADRPSRGGVREAELGRRRRLHRLPADEPDPKGATRTAAVEIAGHRLETSLQDRRTSAT